MGGVVGGAAIPPLLAKVADIHNSTALAMVVPVVFFVAAYTYAVAVNFVPSYRDPADMVGDSDLGLERRSSDEESAEDQKEKAQEEIRKEGV